MARETVGTEWPAVIPSELLEEIGLHPGDRYEIRAEDDHLVLRKVAPSGFDLLASLPPEIWAGAAEEVDCARDEWDD